MSLLMCFVIVEKETNFQNNTSKRFTITVTEVVLIKLFFLTVGAEQKDKNENTT